MIEKARELGLALANTPEFIRMKQAQAAIERNEAVAKLMEDVQQKRQALLTILNEEEQDGTDALELTHDIERLQGQLKENPMFIELVESESEFSALIAAVDREINACIGFERDGCGGNCDSCSGCRH